MFKRIFLAISLLCCIATNSWADTHSAASCSQSDVQAAINASSGGDTVSVPSGNCTWSSPVSVTKGITLQGAGATSTVIAGNTSQIFAVTGDGGDFRLTGFGLTGSVSYGGIKIEGNFNSCRFDHLNITNLSYRFATIGFDTNFNNHYYGATYNKVKVLFDNINFTSNSAQQFLMIYGRWQTWKEDDDYGTDNFVFIEDSTFTYSGSVGTNFIDTDLGNGGRYVFRHNTGTNVSIQMHDSCGQRGNRLVEMYNNTLTCSGSGCDSWPAMASRGGSGVYYNNTINGYSFASGIEIFRVDYVYPDPPSYYGWKIPCPTSGTTKICEDGLSHCSGGDHRVCYPGSPDPCTSAGMGTCVLACSANSDCADYAGNQVGILCMQLDGGGSGNYPCRDQLGRGKDDPITGVQASSPIYWWRNGTDAGCATGETCTNTVNFPTKYEGSYVTSGRDYCNHSPVISPNPVNPGTCNGVTLNYTPYTYPHPWTRGTTGLVAPKNLRIATP